MAQKIDIINLALSRINAARINSLHEDSKQARVASLAWPTAVDAVLRSHSWGFACRREKLARLAGKPLGWEFAYKTPADSIAIRRILPSTVDGADEPTARYKIGNHDGHVAVLCDMANAEAEYTVSVTDCEVFDQQFVDALAWRLAGDFAMALKSDVNLASGSVQMMERAIRSAMGSDAKEQGFEDDGMSSFERARLS